MKTGIRWYDTLLILLFAYLLLAQLYAIWPFTVDDMYISLRYARNWVAGDGLLWNINEPPVEGYSNFSFVVLAALSLFFKANPVLVLKIAGIVGLLSTCLFLYLITRFWFTPRLSLIPCIFLLSYKGQIIWVASGLETAVYEALICGAVYFTFRGVGYKLYSEVRGNPDKTALILAGLFLALAGLTRPEAPVFMVLMFLFLFWDKPQQPSVQFQQGVVGFVLILSLLFGTYFFWRWHYYGSLFPNPVYCKGYSRFIYSVDYNYLKLIWPFAILALLACIKTPDKRHYLLWVPSLIYLVLLVRADPVAAFDNRIFLPAFALLLPLSLLGLAELTRVINKETDSYFVMMVLLSAAFSLFFIPRMTLAQYRYFTQNPVQGEQLRTQVLQWLQTHVKPGADVVLGDAGFIPYFSSLRFIDSYCLNNKIMAHYPPAQMFEQFCYQILLEKPSVIILSSLLEQGEITYAPADACLKNLLEHDQVYRLRQTFMSKTKKTAYKYELFTDF